MKIPDKLTLRITTNARDKTTRILAYRKGGFKRAYKAVIPMCSDESCRRVSLHTEPRGIRYSGEKAYTAYHQRDVDNLVKKLIKSYS